MKKGIEWGLTECFEMQDLFKTLKADTKTNAIPLSQQ